MHSDGFLNALRADPGDDRLTRLSLGGISIPEPVRQLFRDRLGWRALV